MQKAEWSVEKMRFETEQAKLALEQHQLELIQSGALSSDCSGDYGGSSAPSRGDKGFNVLSDLILLPKFNERDPQS